MPSRKLLASLALLGIRPRWGSTFFLIHDLLERMPVAGLPGRAVRDRRACAMLLVAPRAIGRLSPRGAAPRGRAGRLYGVAQILQTAGLAHTPASVSGFITGMYVVCTPLFAALLLHTRIGGLTWAAVALAAAGLGVLTLDGLGRVRRGAHPRRRDALRAAHRRRSAPGRPPGRARHVDPPDAS